MVNEVSDIMRELQSDTISTAAAARRLAALDWPGTGRYATLADTEDDPGAPGPFIVVEGAFVDGRITSDQYAEIVTAIAAAHPVG
jgi:hypothetical protein